MYKMHKSELIAIDGGLFVPSLLFILVAIREDEYHPDIGRVLDTDVE